ncbi:hypothetical protein [Mycobacterium lacus]|uniref:hypothetical protein n=1 Tax=Mycobacterium lacus TaxID=169765 RepID=UPI0013CF8852|nr:hypothetical protein [Mycobacterium lacus]MCV7124355.1 hypothetical protein [Mycobacterium lacus]
MRARVRDISRTTTATAGEPTGASYRWRRRGRAGARCTNTTAASAGGGWWRIEVVLADRAGRWSIVDAEAVRARPRTSIATDIFSFEDLLGTCHDLVDGVPGCVCRISVAPRLDRLYFRYLLRQRLVRRNNVVDFFVSFFCNFDQPIPQIIDGAGGGFERT